MGSFLLPPDQSPQCVGKLLETIINKRLTWHLESNSVLGPTQTCHPKSSWTHVFTDGSAENTVRNGGSGAYICRSDGTSSALLKYGLDINKGKLIYEKY